MKVLVTGASGFIGSAVSLRLLQLGNTVIGIDNHNNYYDPALKEARLSRCANFSKYIHLRIDLKDYQALQNCFSKYKPSIVVNLAAQAGVRFSIENPFDFINSNIVGFSHILEQCRINRVKHLVYASSSSVYGSNTKVPFSVNDNTDHPVSLYAASKKSNELMAHAYSHLYRLPTTGLRFFTVYGPWGRPDMALFKFTKSIIAGDEISVFNYGKHRRDFTYIDDIVEGVVRVIDKPACQDHTWSSEFPKPSTSDAPWRVYNIGNNTPVELMDYIKALEVSLEMQAKIKLLPLQQGDVLDTFADMKEFSENFSFQPKTSIATGINNFVKWYRDYYCI